MKYLLILSVLCSSICYGQVVFESGNRYDSSIVIKTAEYLDIVTNKCVTSTFTMQRGGMNESCSDGTVFGQGLVDSLAYFILGDYEYRVWSTEEGVLYMLIKSIERNKYLFKRLFSQTEETFHVVSVESKIDKVFRLGMGIK